MSNAEFSTATSTRLQLAIPSQMVEQVLLVLSSYALGYSTESLESRTEITVTTTTTCLRNAGSLYSIEMCRVCGCSVFAFTTRMRIALY
eukprot:1588917-Rhodomonas_salina.1